MADEPKSLFTVTEEHLNTGLRGFPVGTVQTSFVDPLEGIHYVGYPVKELWDLDPEAVVYLLFHKDLPTDGQLAEFKAELARRAALPTGLHAFLGSLPQDGHPMAWFQAGLQWLGMVSVTGGDWREDALNVVARMPEMLANVFRLREGWGAPIESQPELGLVENFVQMMGVPGADEEKLIRLLRVFYVLHMDHGGGNLSTFTAKCVASGHADLYTSLSGGMGALSGPLHGRANQSCLEFVKKVGTSDPDEVESFVRNELANKRLIFGFGHAVLRAEDPRATIQYGLGQEICPDDPLFQTAVAMRERAVKVLKENPKVANPYPNVDAVSGTLLNASGLTKSEYYTVLFGFSRCSGIAAQIIDERVNFRGGKGVPIYRCKFIAEGQKLRHR